MVLIDTAPHLDRYGQPIGKRIDHRGTHPVETAAGFIGAVVKFSSGVQSGEHQTRSTYALLVHSHGNSSSVVADGGRAVRLQSHPDGIAIPCQMFVHGIVYNLINQMVQSLSGHTADIHARPLAHRLQSLQYRNIRSTVICICFCHNLPHPYLNFYLKSRMNSDKPPGDMTFPAVLCMFSCILPFCLCTL